MMRSGWVRHGLLSIAVIFGLAVAAIAQPTPEQSRAQAAEALSLLLEDGDREGAMRAALLGLPTDPTETDLASYPEAMSALWRAYANRSVQVDWHEETWGLLSPDGTRAVVPRFVSAPITPNAHDEVVVINPVTGAAIGNLIRSDRPVQAGSLGGAGVAMAPEAGLFTVHFAADVVTHIHRLDDGTRVASLPGPVWNMEVSPDGRHLATSAPQGLSNQPWVFQVREIATGAEVLRTDLAPLHSFAWVSNEELLVGSIGDFEAAAPSFDIRRVDLAGGQTPIPTGPDAPPGLIVLSPDRTKFMILGATDAAVFDMSGQRVFTAPSSDGAAFFLRGGLAVGVARYGSEDRLTGVGLDVYALDGTPLAPQPSDFAFFDTMIYSPDGEVLGTLSGPFSTGGVLEPIGIPEGLDLVAAAQAEVGAPDAVELPEIDPVEQRSEEFAEFADARLRTGDRIGAMVAALKGLPDDPRAEDFARFELAHLMLYRAMAARLLRLDTDENVPFAVGPEGARLAHGGSAPALYAMPSGDLIAPLRRSDGSTFVATEPFFDPSGSLVAISEVDRPVLHAHDAMTGAHVARVEFPIASLSDYAAYSSVLRPAGYSHDGTAFALGTRDHIFLVETEDWSVRQIDPPGSSVGYMAWLPGRQLLHVDPIFVDGPGPVAELHVFDGATMIPVRTIMSDEAGLRSAPGYPLLNRQGSAMMVGEGDSTDGRVVVFDGAGQVRASVIGHEGVNFVRDGTAIAFHASEGALARSLRVISLETGEPLTPDYQDHVVFDQGLFDADGAPIGFGFPGAQGYRGGDVPVGRALWDRAMAEVGADARAEIAAERLVAR